ncbi:MAG: hypothetical protein ACKVSF_10245 [Alphaproteobacteria bacterium]
MADFRIVYPNDAGGVVVVCPPPIARREKIVDVAEHFVGQVRVPATYRVMTDQEYIAFLVQKGDVPNGADYKITNLEDLPPDRYFRNAWVPDAETGAKVDMERAREVHKNVMRAARKPRLAELDVEQLRGVVVEAEKQALRDVTADPAIVSALTPEALKAVWPAVLPSRSGGA